MTGCTVEIHGYAEHWSKDEVTPTGAESAKEGLSG